MYVYMRAAAAYLRWSMPKMATEGWVKKSDHARGLGGFLRGVLDLPTPPTAHPDSQIKGVGEACKSRRARRKAAGLQSPMMLLHRDKGTDDFHGFGLWIFNVLLYLVLAFYLNAPPPTHPLK